MNQVVTLVGFETKTGNNDNGGWTLYLLKDAGGNKYQTFDDDLGAKATKLLNTPAEVTYETTTRDLPAKGDHPATTVTNNVLKAISEANGSAPNVAQSNGQAFNVEVVTKTDYETERQLRIMRQSALQRAIDTAATHGKIEDPQELFKLADTYLLYFEAGSSAFTQAEPELKF